MRLGTSSPNRMVMYVMIATTMAVALTDEARGGTPSVRSHAATSSLKAASPMMPLMMPMEVMPTCTVERNCVGWSSSFRAACAPPSPSSAIAASRPRRVEASAISDMANRALSTVRNAISRKSMNQDRIGHSTLPQHHVPEESLDRVLWSDMQREPAPGELPLLAHYTSIGTLERIAQTGEIWFSNPLYMNDVDELRYGMNLGIHAVRSHAGLREACPPAHYNKLLDAFDELYSAFDNESAFDVYVFSCSEHDDEIGDDGLLSMWRGYGGDGNGVAIVFDLSRLPLPDDSPLLLRQVRYLSHEQSHAWMDLTLERFA